MTPRERAHKARQLLNDDAFVAALEDVQAAVQRELFHAATPEDREAKFQEWRAVERARKRLASWSSEVERHEA